MNWIDVAVGFIRNKTAWCTTQTFVYFDFLAAGPIYIVSVNIKLHLYKNWNSTNVRDVRLSVYLILGFKRPLDLTLFSDIPQLLWYRNLNGYF